MFLVDDKNDNSQSVPVTPTKKRIQSASEDDKHMESLITACQEQEALYEKLYLEYGLVVYKEDYDRDGVKKGELQSTSSSMKVYFFIADEDCSVGADEASTRYRSTMCTNAVIIELEEFEASSGDS